MNKDSSKLGLGLLVGVVIGILGGQFVLGGREAQVIGSSLPLEVEGEARGHAEADSTGLTAAAPPAPLTDRAHAGASVTSPVAAVSADEVRRLIDGVAVSEISTLAGTGTISGRVLDADGSGLPGALVRVTRNFRRSQRSTSTLGAGPPVLEDLEEVVRRAVERHVKVRSNSFEVISGSDGSYRVEGLPEATWNLLAYLEGYALRAIGDTHDVPTGSVVDYRAEAVLAVPVRIVRAGGGAVPEASLLIQRMESRSTRSSHVRWTPDESVVGLLPGRYELKALAGLREDQGSNSVELVLEADATPPEVVLTLESRLGIRGRVIDGPGERVDGTLIAHAYRLSADGEVDLERLEEAEKSDWIRDSGSFEFLDLEPGRHAVGVAWGWDSPICAHQVVEVVDGIIELDLHMPPLAELEFLRVRVLDLAGNDVPGADFSLLSESKSGSGSSGMSPLITASGTYLLTIPARYRKAYFESEEGYSFQLDVSVGELGSAFEGLEPGQLELTVFLGTPAHLEVTVAGFEGSGYEERLDVTVSRTDQGRSSGSGGGGLSADGAKIFEGLQPGDYRVALRLSEKSGGHWGDEIAATLVTLVPGENSTVISLPSLYSFRVLSNEAIEGAHASLGSNDLQAKGKRNFRATFDGDGAAQFVDVPAGEYLLSCGSTVGQVMEVSVPSGDLTFDPKPVNALRVSIVDPDGDFQRLGLRTGDLMIGKDGVEFTGMLDIQSMLISMQQSKTASFELMIQRGSDVLTISVKGSDFIDLRSLGGQLLPASR